MQSYNNYYILQLRNKTWWLGCVDEGKSEICDDEWCLLFSLNTDINQPFSISNIIIQDVPASLFLSSLNAYLFFWFWLLLFFSFWFSASHDQFSLLCILFPSWLGHPAWVILSSDLRLTKIVRKSSLVS